MNHNRRQFVCLAASTALLGGCQGKPSLKKSGGVVLVYKVADFDPAKDDLEKSGMLKAVLRRLDRRQRLGITVKETQESNIQISIPTQEEITVARAKQLLSLEGELRFLIAATERDHIDLVEQARKSPERIVEQGGLVIGEWVKVARNKDPMRTLKAPIEAHVLRDADTGDKIEWTDQQRTDIQRDPRKTVEFLKARGVNEVEVLMSVDEPGKNFRSEHLKTVRLVKSNGQISIEFSTNAEGGKVLDAFSTRNLSGLRHLAIIFDDEILSMPRLQSRLTDRGRISGQFTEAEAQLIVDVLRVGKLPFRLESPPISETTIDAP